MLPRFLARGARAPRPLVLIAALTAALLNPGRSGAQELVIDSRDPRDLGFGYWPFSWYSRAAGQSFTAPTGARVLTGVRAAFRNGEDGPGTLSTRLYRFSGGSLGPLVAQGEFVLPARPSEYQWVGLTGLNVGTTSGETFLFLVEQTADTDPLTHGIGPSVMANYDYPGGRWYIIPVGHADNPAHWDPTSADVELVAEFATSAVPEPTTLLLLGTGLLSLAAVARRRPPAG